MTFFKGKRNKMHRRASRKYLSWSSDKGSAAAICSSWRQIWKPAADSLAKPGKNRNSLTQNALSIVLRLTSQACFPAHSPNLKPRLRDIPMEGACQQGGETKTAIIAELSLNLNVGGPSPLQ
jgi:hypothetical protein